MAIRPFLAMTAAEIHNTPQIPDRIGWMACHFSPYSLGLANRPKALPAGSLLILNDVIPVCGHEPEVVAAQLLEGVDAFSCFGVLLDFQRPHSLETERMAAFLSEALPCPLAVSEPYAGNLTCPVFLSPLPLHLPLKEYTAPWKGREIWLELAMDAEEIHLTEAGAAVTPLPCTINETGHQDNTLHCHYRIELTEDAARFTLWRTKEDIDSLLEEAKGLGITAAVGLYQEFS